MRLLASITFLVWAASANAGTPVKTAPSIDLGADPIYLGEHSHIEWVQTPANVDSTRNDKPLDWFSGLNWTRSEKLPNFGPGTDTVWYRLHVKNTFTSPQDFVVLSTDGAIAEQVVLHVYTDSRAAQTARAGTAMAMQDRTIASRLIALPFHMESGEKAEIFIGINSSYSRNMLFQIRTVADWHQYEDGLYLFFGVFFGFLLLCALINAAFFAVIRHPAYLAYASMCVTCILAAVIGMGFFSIAIPADWVVNVTPYEICFVGLVVSTLSWFAREFLETRDWTPVGYRVLTAFIVLGLVHGTLGAFQFLPSFNARGLSFTLDGGAVAALLIGLFGVRTKHRTAALFFIGGAGIYMLGGTVWDMQFSAKIPSTPLTTHFVFVTQYIESVVFSFALLLQVRGFVIRSVAAGEAEKYGERMSTMVRVLTHDLANYIVMIDGNATLLSRTKAPADSVASNAIAKIQKAAHKQRELIENIRDLKALEDGKSLLVLSPVHINSQLEELKHLFEERLQQKNLSFEVVTPAGEELYVLAEPISFFHSVLSNLVSNAIKFSQPGGLVRILAERHGEKIRIEVRDSGVGIPAATVPNLFSGTVRTTSIGTSGEQGTGFGLPICKAFVDRFGGNISVATKTLAENPTGHGTTFTIIMPRAMRAVENSKKSQPTDGKQAA